ncbi:MAG: OmpA family protein [Bacteroidia bacterium]|jgi:chemotaxis protein MotB
MSVIKFASQYLLVFCLIFNSCSSLKDAKTQAKNCNDNLKTCQAKLQQMELELADLSERQQNHNQQLKTLIKDTTSANAQFRQAMLELAAIQKLNTELKARINQLQNGSDRENAKLSGSLQKTRDDLLKKQDELNELENQLNRQRKALDILNEELKKREARVAELEDILKRKDDAVTALKRKLSEALLGFENKGLTITQKNGKVYVSMDESLLFASGKTEIEGKGVEALRHVAKVLEQNPDINIMVEGHTDDVPMNGKGEIKDNWDLSVMRATSITKIILNAGNINGSRITAAGRAEYFPLEKGSTPDVRKKNRRTELILSPKLDELFKVLENN